MNQWLMKQVERVGLFRVLALLWVMVLTTIVTLWFMFQPEKLDGIALVIGGGVLGLVATVLTFVKSKKNG